MTEIAAPVPAPLPLARAVEAAAPAATPLASSTAPVRRRPRWRRLASVVADTHRAAVPF